MDAICRPVPPNQDSQRSENKKVGGWGRGSFKTPAETLSGLVQKGLMAHLSRMVPSLWISGSKHASQLVHRTSTQRINNHDCMNQAMWTRERDIKCKLFLLEFVVLFCFVL